MKSKFVVMSVAWLMMIAGAVAQTPGGAQSNQHPAFKVDVKGSGTAMILIPGLATALCVAVR